MTRSVFLSLWLIATAALAAPWPVAPAAVGPTSFTTSFASIATNGSHTLVVWQVQGSYPFGRIDAMPLDAVGRPARATARTVVTGAYGASPRLFAWRDGFLLSYAPFASYAPPGLDKRVFVELAADGTPLRHVLPEFASTSSVAVSKDGSRILVIEDTPVAGRGRGTLLDGNGNVIAEMPLPDRFNGSIEAGNDDFLVVSFAAEADVEILRVAASGAVETLPHVPVSWSPGSYLSGLAIGRTGTDVFVATSSSAGDTTAAIVSGGTVTPVAFPPSVVPLAVVATGSGYMVFVGVGEPTRASIGVVRYDGRGNALDPAPVIIARSEENWVGFHTAVWNGQSAIAIASEYNVGTFTLAVSESGTLGEIPRHPFQLDLARQTDVVAASDGASSLVVWMENLAGSTRGRAAVVSAGGTSEPVDLGEGAWEPQVSFAGGVYLVVWHADRSLFGFRVSSDGRPLDKEPFSINPDPLNPSRGWANAWTIGSNGSAFVVAWVDASPSTTIRAAVVPVNGPAGVPHEIATGKANSTVIPSGLAWNGRRFVLAWVESTLLSPFPPVSVHHDVYVTPLAADATREGPPLRLEGYWGGDAAVATNGRDFLLVTIYGGAVWLDASGKPAGPAFRIDDMPANMHPPAVSWTGTHYVIARHVFSPALGWRLRVSFFAPGQTTPELERSVESRPDIPETRTAAVSGPCARPFVAFTDLRDEDPDGRSGRILIQWIDELWQSNAKRRGVAR